MAPHNGHLKLYIYAAGLAASSLLFPPSCSPPVLSASASRPFLFLSTLASFCLSLSLVSTLLILTRLIFTIFTTT